MGQESPDLTPDSDSETRNFTLFYVKLGSGTKKEDFTIKASTTFGFATIGHANAVAFLHH